jgi:cytochrome b6
MADKPETAQRGRLYSWLQDRFHIETARKFFAKKTVPQHRNTVWYYIGGITLFLLMVQLLSGILLLLYYRPSAEHAFESVQFIMTEVEFGWLVRSVHSWGANLLVFMAFAHLFSTLLMKAYRPPRETTWMTGVVLMVLLLAFGFTGYLLPWNELSLAATKVGTEIAGSVPLVGQWLKEFLRGGEDVTGSTLTRMFGFHVAVLPALTTIILAIHLTLIQIQGMSEPIGWRALGEEERKRRQMKFFPNFFYRDMLAWVLALWLLAAIASLFPWELGQKADLFAPTPPGVKPEWYFMFMYVTLEAFTFSLFGIPNKVIVVSLFGLLGLLFFLLPFIDRKARRDKPSPVITAIGWIAIAYILATTFYGYMQ